MTIYFRFMGDNGRDDLTNFRYGRLYQTYTTESLPRVSYIVDDEGDHVFVSDLSSLGLWEEYQQGIRRVYIAGPMSGHDDYNYHSFNAIAEELKESGLSVMNPAILPKGFTESQYMDVALAMLKTCDTIYMLPGWEDSLGATVEYHLARKLGMTLIHHVGEITTQPETDEWVVAEGDPVQVSINRIENGIETETESGRIDIRFRFGIGHSVTAQLDAKKFGQLITGMSDVPATTHVRNMHVTRTGRAKGKIR